jgi:hypothetical protein
MDRRERLLGMAEKLPKRPEPRPPGVAARSPPHPQTPLTGAVPSRRRV